MEYLKNLIDCIKFGFIGIFSSKIRQIAYAGFVIWIILLLNIGFLPWQKIYADTKPTPTKANAQFTDVILEQYKKELHLVLPDVVDDPAYKVVFSNPYKDKPVVITIDGREYKDVKSPFALPNLSLGTHSVVIKFSNKDGIPRTISMQLTVVPREPVVDQTNKTLFHRPNPIIIKGKAMAFAKIMVIINGSDIQYTNVDANGDWTFLVKTPKQGTYKFLFFTYKNGVISKKFANLTVRYDTGETTTITVTPTNIPIKQKVMNIGKNYKNEILGGSIVALGVILIWVAIKVRVYFKKKWEAKEIAELINKDRPDIGIEEVVKDLSNKKQSKEAQKSKSKRSKLELSDRVKNKGKQVKKQRPDTKKIADKNESKKGLFSGIKLFLSKTRDKKAVLKGKVGNKLDNKKKINNSQDDITSLVFGSNDDEKNKKAKRGYVKSNTKTKTQKQESNKKNIKNNGDKNSDQSDDIKIDKKELSKNEFLGLFKKSKK